MSLNTLETSYVNGQIIDASHINELTLSLLGQFVGRDANGVPTPLQSLGTLAIPWGNLYANGIILDGQAIDTSQIVSLPNRVVSGKTRPLSSFGDFIRANGSALEFDILGGTTELVLAINNNAATVNSDLNVAGVVAAPSANNTADINDADMSNDLYAGEDESEIVLDNVGSEVTNKVGQIVAFQTPTGEIFQGYLKDSTTITNVFRGYYFDDSGNPIKRDNLSNNDTITLMNLGWIFVEDNGTTVDVSYLTPSISYTAPSSPQTGQYWFDIANQVWKRYSGASFEIIDRILVGQIIADDTNCIASRSADFNKTFEEANNAKIELQSGEIVKVKENKTKISVYGTQISIDTTFLSWNITTDLETGLIEAANTVYYLYLSDQGQPIISDKKPYWRADLKGDYHPYESWRLIGMVNNDASSDFEFTWDENTSFALSSGDSGTFSTTSSSYTGVSNSVVSFLSRGNGEKVDVGITGNADGSKLGLSAAGATDGYFRTLINKPVSGVEIICSGRIFVNDGSSTDFLLGVPSKTVDAELGINTASTQARRSSSGSMLVYNVSTTIKTIKRGK